MRNRLVLPWGRAAAPIPPSPAPSQQHSVAAVPKSAAPEQPAAPKASPPKIVAVTVLGLEGDALVNVIGTVTAECRQVGTRPLFITDQSEFKHFRSGRSLFEQVVDLEVCMARSPGLDWQGYSLQQYRLIGRKWKPITMIAFGRQPIPQFSEAVIQGAREKL